MSAGAAGYIPKTSTPTVTVSAIKLVLDGGLYVPPHILNIGNADIMESTNQNRSSHDGTLTRRQLQVMQLIESGKSNNTIAEELGLSTGTVKMHVSGIFKKLNASSRTEAVALYAKIRNSGS
jgi:DNA-binding NarL/FixJ family response regulator